MRLAVFTNQFPGPVSTFFARDMRGLIDAGIEIDIFPIAPLDETLWRYVPEILNEKILPRSKVHHLTIPQCFRSDGLRPSPKLAGFLKDTVSISASAIRYGIEPFAKSSYVFLKAWTWAHQYLDEVDHVLAYWGNYTATCAYLFHRLRGGKQPFSLFLHASIDLYNKPIYLREKLKYADNIITCSAFNRTFILERFRELNSAISGKLHIHHHGLDFSKLAVSLNGRSANKVIAVGRFAKQKGFDYLLHAVRELKDRGADFQLELVGDGEEAGALQSLAKRLEVLDRVRFPGWVAADEVPIKIARATVLVHPSPDLGDGVPNVIKEAMAVGTPVIGSRVAGIPELLDYGSHGMLVPPKNSKALADAIHALFKNKELQRRHAAAARKHSETRFDLWKNGQQLAAVLRGTRRREGHRDDN